MFTRNKMVKVDEDKLIDMIEKMKKLEEDLSYYKTQNKVLHKELEKTNSLLSEINSLDINTSTIKQRDKAVKNCEQLKLENKSLKNEVKYLRITNESNNLLLQESLSTLKSYTERSSNLKDKTYLIDEIC